MSADTTVTAPLAAAPPRPGRRRVPALPPSFTIGAVLVALVVAGAAFAPLLSGQGPLTLSADTLRPPSWAHPLGTDDLGRDLFARVLHGGRVSLLVGLCSAVIGVALGTAIGLVAGFFGGPLDELLMRITEMFQILPRLLVTIVIVALIGGGMLNLVLVIGFLSWPVTARLIRARVLVLRQEDFMTAARMSGASWLRLLIRHALPNVATYLTVSASLQVAAAILSEAFLSFLGLGDPDRPSWGFLLQQGQLYIQQAWWLTTFPGIALALAILGLNLMGDGLRAAPGKPRP